MESPPPSPSVLETLRTVEFRLGLKGYNVDEVDEYLEKAAVEAEGLHEQLRQMVERLRQASERIAQLEAERRQLAAVPVPVEAPPDDTLQRTLVLAQKFVDQTKRESEAEAAELVAQAEER
ncbi:MAG: DivIVA domain-containing protein, partial [Acidimicrobiales bacterium]